MCGRIANTLPVDAMAQLFAALPANNLPAVPNFNICPTDGLSVVVSGEGRRLVSMRWGFVPHWYKALNDGPLLINARAETIAQKPAFAQACRMRRCLIPASGYFEWTKDEAGQRLPWYFHPREDVPIVFAGIWQSWEGNDGPLNSCAIVTTAANAEFAPIHHRMPVTVAQDDWGLWLGEDGKGASRLMRSPPKGQLVAHRVDVAVNSNRASGPELIEPLA